MTVRLLPDVEKLVSVYLRAHTAVTALVAQRVYTVIPNSADAEEPLVRLTQFNSLDAIPNVPHLDAAFLQVDAYGGPKAVASLIGRTVRAALADLPGTHDEGIVTGVRTAGWAYDPDGDFPTARPRFRFDLTVWAHPNPLTGS